MPSVLYIHTRFSTPGGANTVAVETANRLAPRSDFEMSIATATFNTDYYDLHSEVTLREVGGGSPGSISHWLRLPAVLQRVAGIIEEKDIDIIVFHSIPTPYWTAALKRLHPEVQYIWYAHDPNAYLNLPGKISDVPTPLRLIMQLSLPLVRYVDRRVIGESLDAVIANSNFTRQVLKDSYSVDPYVIYPGINSNRVPEEADDSERVIFTVGQLNRYNNHDVLIRAMSNVAERLEDPPRLVVGGTGPFQQHLEMIASEEDVGGLVDFIGYVPESELYTRYATALATVYLPEKEPFGLVPIESMATGTPVIAVDSGGFKETISNGKTGILVPEASESAVTDALIRLVESPELRSKMGQAAKQRITSKFSIEDTTNELASYLKRGSL